MMRVLHGCLLGAALAVTASAASAQRLGTVELGGFGHYTIVKNDAALGEHSTGFGVRGGLFLARWLEGEVEYGRGTVENGGVRYPEGKWNPMRIFGTVNLPLAPRVKLLLGVGAVDSWKGDISNNEFEEGISALAGLRVCFGDAWSFRPEVVYDRAPSPAKWMQRNYLAPNNGVTSTRWQIRAGVSRFFVRGTTTCHESKAPEERRTVPPPQPVTPVPAPTPPPPPPPRATASLSASPSSIVSGQSAQLNWDSGNATQCSAPWMSGGATRGSVSVYPTSTTTFTITCTGAGGSGNASATINVSQPAPPPPPTPAPTPTPVPPRDIFRLSGVFFDFDKSTLKPAGRVMLDSAVKLLNRSPELRVEIQGHTDSVGTDAYNQKLSERRANTVYEYLVSKGISAGRLTMRGFGESQPATSNSTAEGRAENRRVMLIELR